MICLTAVLFASSDLRLGYKVARVSAHILKGGQILQTPLIDNEYDMYRFGRRHLYWPIYLHYRKCVPDTAVTGHIVCSVFFIDKRKDIATSDKVTIITDALSGT